MLSPAARAFWEEFAAASGVQAQPSAAFRFGDSKEMADELVRLVRSLARCMAAHVAFFEREAARGGVEMHPDIETVFERFDVVWPRASGRQG